MSKISPAIATILSSMKAKNSKIGQILNNPKQEDAEDVKPKVKQPIKK